MTVDDPKVIAEGLSRGDVQALLQFRLEPRMMGFGGFDPRLVEPTGFNHPIYGSHYQPTTLGQQVLDILINQETSHVL